MKRTLLGCFLVLMALSIKAQVIYENFESNFLNTGWDTINLSGPTKGIVKAWFKSSQFSSPPPAKEGLYFYGSNYKAEGNNGTVSSWIFPPTRTFKNGDLFQFYTL